MVLAQPETPVSALTIGNIGTVKQVLIRVMRALGRKVAFTHWNSFLTINMHVHRTIMGDLLININGRGIYKLGRTVTLSWVHHSEWLFNRTLIMRNLFDIEMKYLKRKN